MEKALEYFVYQAVGERRSAADMLAPALRPSEAIRQQEVRAQQQRERINAQRRQIRALEQGDMFPKSDTEIAGAAALAKGGEK